MRLIKTVVMVLVCSIATWAQSNQGGITGTVFDQNGAVVPGATVVITDLGTKRTTTLTTSDSGTFTARSLEPVAYSVRVEANGFKKAIIEHVKVDTATVATVNITLETGTVGETVTISSEAALINTDSAATTQTISERQIRDLPLNNRSVLDLAVTVPNVTGDAGSEDPDVASGQPVPGFNLNVNGGRAGSTSILADGVNNTGVGIARAVVSFTPETVQEFTVQTSAYSAEYGYTGGGIINATTKSGTNDFNGVALWYHRNPATNARNYTIGNGPRTPNNRRYNQVSVTVGGPVYLPRFGEGGKRLYDGHNRTFFFFAYEPRWLRDFLDQTTLLPTAAERAGDFRNLVRTSSGLLPAAVAARFNAVSTGNANIYQQFQLVNGRLVPIVLPAGFQYCQFGDPRATISNGAPVCTAAVNAVPNNALNVIPAAYIDPTAPKVLAFMPPPSADYFLDGTGLVRNYIVHRFVQQDETRYTLRLDHSITNNNKINFRYTKTPAVGVRGFGSDINGNSAAYSDAKQFLLADNHLFSPTLVNDLRLNYTRGVFSEDFSPEFSIQGGRNLASELGLPSLTSGGMPLFQISGDNLTNAFADVGSSGSTNNFNVEERFNINDVVYWTRGNMSWRFGIDLNYERLNVIPFFGASGGRWEFRTVNSSNNRSTNAANGGSNLASLLIGVPNAVQVRPLLLNYDYRWKAGATFVQNDWKIKPNLTLNLGLRYTLQYPRTEKNNLQGVFRPDLAQPRVLTAAERRATAIGLGLIASNSPANTPIPSVVPTSVLIPPFAFSGRGGRSEYLTPIDYMGFEPRFGFAWSPKYKWAEDRTLVIRGGYGISHLTLTGNNRLPNPDLGGFTPVSTLAIGSTAGATVDATQPVRLTGNQPFIAGGALDTALGTNADGLVFNNSLGIPGFAINIDGSGKVPYSQNWNLSFQFEAMKNLVVEVAYVGNKGTHLYMPLVNINPKDINFVEFLEGQSLIGGGTSETTFNDPLGRKNALGATVTIPRSSVVSPYFGFNNLLRFFDPSANSIRHAGYVDVRRRVGRGLSLTANYTFAKSIDDASDSSADTRTLTTPTNLGQQVSFGFPRSLDRAISTFDIKHNFTATALYDLPFGKGRRFLTDAPGIVNAVFGGWTLSSIARWQGGQPFVPFITDTNRLSGTNRSIRLDIVPGVPLKNPLYSAGNCSTGGACEPFINPSAFMRPAKGSVGDAARTLEIRAPMQEFFDFSIQKDFRFPFGGDSKRRINFRVDFINAFNHPNFRYGNTGNTPNGFGSAPSEADLNSTEINNWNAFAPGRNATLAQINGLIASSRSPSGGLPLDFFRVSIPQGFATTNPNAFDITTLSGLKLYRLRQAYDTNFGVLGASPPYVPRYIQFGLRIFF